MMGNIKIYKTTIKYDTISPFFLFNLPIGATINQVQLVIDIPFTKAGSKIQPTLSIGMPENIEKYMKVTSILRAINSCRNNGFLNYA